MSKFISKSFDKLKAYTPGEQPFDKQYIKLNTNESPFLPSPKATASINAEAMSALRLYSDSHAVRLTNAIADNFNVLPENVIVANGSDEILAFSFLAFGTDKTTAFADITYGFYKVFAQLYRLKTREVLLDDGFNININDYLRKGENVVIANPNAPTGKAISLTDIQTILKTHENDVVLIDEAYVDFGAKSATSLINKYNNLLVVQTFSKSRNLAGARVGYAIASKEIIEDLQRIRNSFNPYNVNSLSLLLAENAMLDNEYFIACTQSIIQVRESFIKQLTALQFDVLQSETNFVFAKHKTASGEQVYEYLKLNGVLVRWFNESRINAFVRITIGTKAQMQLVLNVLKKWNGEIK